LTRSQESLKESAEAAYQQLRVDLVLQIKQAYYSVLQARELVRVQEESLVSRRANVEQARARFQAGLGLPSDVTRAETALSATLFQLSTAQTNFSTRRLELNQFMGLDPRVTFELRDASEVPLDFQTSEELFDRALQARPELVQYRANLESAQAALDAAHTQSAPVLGSSLQYQNRQQPSVESISLNLTLSFNAWDGGLQNGKIKEAEAGVDRARAELEAARQRVLGQVGQAYLQLKNAEQQVLSAQAEEANARETQRLAEGRYKVGLGILLDVLDAQAALLVAQANRVNAQTQLQISRAALARALGESSLSKAGPP
jgi:outer membrane protein